MKKVALTDFAKYRYPSALELSPDGRYLTFALKEVDSYGVDDSPRQPIS